LCTEVIEHVVEPVAVLEEFRRLLKPGGRLLLTAPMISAMHMEPYHYFGGFTHFWYRHWLPEKGFAIESITPVGGPGRTCVNYCQVFYTAWSSSERRAKPVQRWGSRLLRIAAKPLVHYLLPWLLPRFDDWLGSSAVCSCYLVAATRLPANS
jgi:SAM-dependent methyltransferase